MGVPAYETGVVLDGVNASRWFGQSSPNYMLEYEDSTTFGGGGFTEKAITLADFGLTFGGTLVAADHPKIRALAERADEILGILAMPTPGDSPPTGLKVGNVAIIFGGYAENFARRGPVAGLVGFDMGAKAGPSGIRMMGRVLSTDADITANANGDAVDFNRGLSTAVVAAFDAAARRNGTFQVNVTNMPANITAATAKLQDSASTGSTKTWADVPGASLDLHTLLGSGNTGGVRTLPTADTPVDRFLRVVFSVTGATSSNPLRAVAAYGV